MLDQRIIQRYINDFRRHFVSSLKPGIGLAAAIYPTRGQGAILAFKLGSDIENDDTFAPAEDTVNAALEHVPQRMIGGNLSGVKFGGTNISMEPNRIVMIKGEDDDDLWNDQAAKKDAQRILQSFSRARP
jgi:hypothetical protein